MKKRGKKTKKNKIKYSLSNQKGMALLTTLIFVFVLVTFAVALLTMTSNDSKLSTLQRESTRAFYLAETGIEKAIWYLNSSEDNPDGLNFYGTLPVSGVTATEFYEVEISIIDDTGPYEVKTLISTGKVREGEYNKGTRKIEVKLNKGIAPYGGLNYTHAIFTNDDMTINGGVSVSGNIHSNGDLYVSSPGVFNLEDGEATACGTNDYGDGDQPEQDFPAIAWDYFQGLAEDGIDGGHYYDGDYTFEGADTILTGIHFIPGNVIIKNDVFLINATIMATGTIDVLGSGDVTLGNEIIDHPLALVAKEGIEIRGSVHGEGIIQTEGNFRNLGNVNIEEGAIYAELGVFNGGGGAALNVSYSTKLLGIPVPGTGIPVWKKTSWREIY
jgi:Tfp pilus assembly protein PilX